MAFNNETLLLLYYCLKWLSFVSHTTHTLVSWMTRERRRRCAVPPSTIERTHSSVFFLPLLATDTHTQLLFCYSLSLSIYATQGNTYTHYSLSPRRGYQQQQCSVWALWSAHTQSHRAKRDTFLGDVTFTNCCAGLSRARATI